MRDQKLLTAVDDHLYARRKKIDPCLDGLEALLIGDWVRDPSARLAGQKGKWALRKGHRTSSTSIRAVETQSW